MHSPKLTQNSLRTALWPALLPVLRLTFHKGPHVQPAPSVLSSPSSSAQSQIRNSSPKHGLQNSSDTIHPPPARPSFKRLT